MGPTSKLHSTTESGWGKGVLTNMRLWKAPTRRHVFVKIITTVWVCWWLRRLREWRYSVAIWLYCMRGLFKLSTVTPILTTVLHLQRIIFPFRWATLRHASPPAWPNMEVWPHARPHDVVGSSCACARFV